jgi:cobalt-zinc-cadmium efflux system outer membrane protein
MRQSAGYRFTFAEAAAALDADTAYTRALATRELAKLSRQNALDADSLRHLASVRADAGDAAALDVELATIFAGQQANAALGDSLEWMSAIIDLQGVMGLSVTNVVITLTDSLTLPPEGAPNPVRPGLPVLAASSALDAANLSIQQQRRSKWSMPSLTLGLDARDVTSDTRGPYPVIGVAVPLPFFSGNRGSVAVATAERERAVAELAAAKVDYATISAQAQRRLTTARTRLDGDRLLVTSADRVATLFLTAYREGAATIANVLEAQRTVREVRAQYINDLADVVIASATVRAYPPSAAAGNP